VHLSLSSGMRRMLLLHNPNRKPSTPGSDQVPIMDICVWVLSVRDGLRFIEDHWLENNTRAHFSISAGKSSCTLAMVGPWRGSLESYSVFGHLFAFAFPYWVRKRGVLWLATHKADWKISTTQSRSAPCLIIVVLINLSALLQQCSMHWHKKSIFFFFFLEICLLRATAAAGTQCCSVHWEMYSNVEEINTLMLKVSVLNYWTWQRKYWISPVLLTQHTALTFWGGLGFTISLPCVWACEMMRDGRVTAI